MTKKKKIMMIVFLILSAVIIASSAVLTTAAIVGRQLKVNPSRKLDGVNDDIQNALWYSSIAANSHNTQMWSVKLYPNENRLQISIDESRVLGVVDCEKREAYISLGCYVETMSVAFNAYGYDTQISCNDMSVQVTYQKRENSTVDTAKLALIDKRHTDKSAYWTTTRESAKGEKFSQQGIDTAKKQLDNCGAFAVITGGNTFEELINTGRKTQAFWFDCTEKDIAVQPFSSALETQPFCSSIQNDLGVTASVQMILRLGYVNEYGVNCGVRRNLSDYIQIID